ncbi:MAG: hypothetical protein IPN82_03405 [Chitinophagaceae bacterium]|nr:hypothetical protein [Chitinophagaceae bacterium]MBP6477303.1 hypothetical protein [Chitinophagaceae bacterium]MBP7108907.1 hypothetical protein [Chitinophagaceae bacterium]MBP7314281.1 hypothetical protein [Chitinophagaceae bacterium]
MKIGEIGQSFDSTTKIDYLSDKTFIEYDMLIIDIDFMTYGHNVHSKRLYDKRKSELAEFLQFKKTPLILLSPSPRSIQFSNGTRNASFPLCSLLPIPEFETQSQSGEKIIIKGNTSFTNFFKKYNGIFNYNVIFTTYSGIDTLEVPLTQKVISFYNDTSIFLPRIFKKITKEEEGFFLKDLFETARNVIEINKPSLPIWADSIFLPGERKIKDEIIETMNEISKLNLKLEEKSKNASNYNDKKRLITGTGNELEFEIENIFRKIDIEILESDRNRDDLIIKYNNRVAVVEIKGVSGSSAEKHAAQLEKWVASYYDKTEVKAKGILIVNAFKDLKIEERSDSPFPDQMVSEYSIPRGHCLITSLQLLGIYYAIIENPSKRDELINSLFDTIGVYKEFNDWSKFINVK